MNAVYHEKACEEEFQSSANNDLGMNQTFYKSAVIFVLIGMVFGWPLALHYFSALQWINTSLWKRLLRTVLGLALVFGTTYFIRWTVEGTNDISTLYFFGYSVPYFATSFFVFGLYPIVCSKWLGLCSKADTLREQGV